MDYPKYVLSSATSDDSAAYAAERNWHHEWWRWVADTRLPAGLVLRYDRNTEQDWPND